jgi:hypothetical protein
MPVTRVTSVDFPEPGGPESTSAGSDDASHARMRDRTHARATKAEFARAVTSGSQDGSPYTA